MTDEQIQSLLDLNGEPLAVMFWQHIHLKNMEPSLYGQPGQTFQDKCTQENNLVPKYL